MSWPGDLHDPQQDMDRLDNLVLSALGEPVDPDFAAHLTGCPQCQAELDGLTHTAGLARESSRSDLPDAGPSPAVWDSIVAELGLDAAPPAAEASAASAAPAASAASVTPLPVGARPRASSGGSRSWLLAAAAAVLAVVAGGIGYTLADDEADSSPVIAATASLAAMPGGPEAVAGDAKIVESADGPQLVVTALGLPVSDGYYEVWLFNPDLNQMVAVGTLPSDHAGTFPVPAGLDPADYRVVDVSAQEFDGNPVHQQSVLRGQLSS